MKTIIAGSRSISQYDLLERVIKLSGFNITEVVSGTARGVDRLGELWAKAHDIPVKQFPANWDKYGKRAGYLRNEQMAQYAHALIALWDGVSSGTHHMIDLANKHDLQVFMWVSTNDH